MAKNRDGSGDYRVGNRDPWGRIGSRKARRGYAKPAKTPAGGGKKTGGNGCLVFVLAVAGTLGLIIALAHTLPWALV